MKTIKTRLILTLLAMSFSMLATSCADKKPSGKTETTASAANVESPIPVSPPTFKQFVVVTVEESALYKTADTESPILVKYVESDCESDYCKIIFQWSDEPAKPGFEISTDISACEGTVYPVLGEEGDFYKVGTLNLWNEIESAYIPQKDVGSIESAPITAEELESADIFIDCRVLKAGKYKDVGLSYDVNELEGERLHVGLLADGVVATPLIYFIDCSLDISQKEDIIIEGSEGSFNLRYSKNLSKPNVDHPDDLQLDISKLSDDQIAKIIDTVAAAKPDKVECMYHFPAMGPQYFYYKSK